ncbi:N-acetylmuramic acid 6-phosphate etherase [Listeria booriae]|uniref:N-acetylmuramic acid 6-phosphate etherase n=1 Tax=Listeria booriae TaxID=1552123 RepID=A0A842F091_9LIST|nr:N-acetylmuramic acid 6-phosphate etherase [Listeria booriae]MBC2240815.1 N-acetylmuramic acid 6-phosphate etherase [Listeria booriae]
MLENLSTEKRNEKTASLDTLSVKEALHIMNDEDAKVTGAIATNLASIETVINGVIASFKKGGRLVYVGAGTSGRLGVLDAAECVPTFGVPATMVVGLIAGGEKAFLQAIEGAEDSVILGKEDLEGIALTADDYVLGIAASGRTPYVIGALDYAKEVGAKTGALSCNTNAAISAHADTAIEVDCGPEILTGSTRLKAGTAQKLVLNMISTVSMIGIGKVYKNLMVDVMPTNEKLVERSKRIIMEATECDYDTAANYYELANQHVKTAIVMILTKTDLATATEKLADADGFIRRTL